MPSLLNSNIMSTLAGCCIGSLIRSMLSHLVLNQRRTRLWRAPHRRVVGPRGGAVIPPSPLATPLARTEQSHTARWEASRAPPMCPTSVKLAVRTTHSVTTLVAPVSARVHVHVRRRVERASANVNPVHMTALDAALVEPVYYQCHYGVRGVNMSLVVIP
ncbi:hypothetical protein J6590_021339 [Homalodisca vitripennis]|nr:hypothetical protein J6590_021339 [Homalodisca vitripennis]